MVLTAVHETLGRHISLVNEQLRREGAKMTAENDMFSGKSKQINFFLFYRFFLTSFNVYL